MRVAQPIFQKKLSSIHSEDVGSQGWLSSSAPWMGSQRSSERILGSLQTVTEAPK